jgi:FMN phosphatase YigB (HAD superfamily)
MRELPTKSPRAFAHVETWVFDLDNTLYPHHVNLWQQVDGKIRDFVANFLRISPDEAFKVPEGLLQALRHHHARHDDRTRRPRRRLSGFRPRDRSFAAGAEPGDGRRDRTTCPAAN